LVAPLLLFLFVCGTKIVIFWQSANIAPLNLGNYDLRCGHNDEKEVGIKETPNAWLRPLIPTSSEVEPSGVITS